MDIANLKNRLAEINSHMNGVAQSAPAGSPLNELAFGIHNLIACVEELADEVAAQNRKG